MEQNGFLGRLLAKKAKGQKALCVLIDPDKASDAHCYNLLEQAEQEGVDCFLVGGSLIANRELSSVVRLLKSESNVPVIIFPGNNTHICDEADGMLFLSLISGRNPEFLIGQHVVAAPLLKGSQLEILPTGYILVNSGNATTASYMSGTNPIPNEKPAIAACTAMAGEMLGLRLIYIDGGSGANQPISRQVVKAVSKSIDAPLIVGGGITDPSKMRNAYEAGADAVVIGTVLEEQPEALANFLAAKP